MSKSWTSEKREACGLPVFMGKEMKLWMCLLLGALTSVASADCIKGEGDVVHARYDIHAGSQRYSVDFYRGADQVAWRRGEVISVWTHRDQAASLLRVFPQYQRTIWYPAGDLRALGKEAQWRGVMGWPDPQSRDYRMVGGSSSMVQGCPAQEYQGSDGGKVLWLDEVQLPARMADAGAVWQLVSLQRVARADTFGLWSQWQSTDFADVGDNESDPFLRRMISLGFVEHGASGFYHADGSPLPGADHHAH